MDAAGDSERVYDRRSRVVSFEQSVAAARWDSPREKLARHDELVMALTRIALALETANLARSAKANG